MGESEKHCRKPIQSSHSLNGRNKVSPPPTALLYLTRLTDTQAAEQKWWESLPTVRLWFDEVAAKRGLDPRNPQIWQSIKTSELLAEAVRAFFLKKKCTFLLCTYPDVSYTGRIYSAPAVWLCYSLKACLRRAQLLQVITLGGDCQTATSKCEKFGTAHYYIMQLATRVQERQLWRKRPLAATAAREKIVVHIKSSSWLGYAVTRQNQKLSYAYNNLLQRKKHK